MNKITLTATILLFPFYFTGKYAYSQELGKTRNIFITTSEDEIVNSTIIDNYANSYYLYGDYKSPKLIDKRDSSIYGIVQNIVDNNNTTLNGKDQSLENLTPLGLSDSNNVTIN